MNDKFILDACCGGRMMWFNKEHPNTIYMDNRDRDKGLCGDFRPNFKVKPDIVADFRNMSFENNSFKLIVFNPPHIIHKKQETSHLTQMYGRLEKENWKELIKKGFDECWRVLDNHGVLIFKWSETSIKIKEVLDVIGEEPLFGTRINKGTVWTTFMKITDDALHESKDDNNVLDEVKDHE